MPSPRFSILIPTRERAQTLGPCIQTCLAQRYDNLEILVSDNAGGPETRAVVSRFNDPRLKYFRQETRVSMRQNFESLAQKATGDYLIFIGDDDGMMPHAIEAMAAFLSSNPVDVLNWTGVVYYWPGRLFKNAGVLNFKYQKIFGGLSNVDIQKRLAGFAKGTTPNYIYGCNIYHGCVSRRVIDEVRAVTGQVFSDHMPDVYACIAFMFVARSMVYLDHPLSISGVSLASNGFSFFHDVNSDASALQSTPHDKFVAEAQLDSGVPHPYNADLRASQYHTANALVFASKAFRGKHEIDLDAWARIIVEEARHHCDLTTVAAMLSKDRDIDRAILAALNTTPVALQTSPNTSDPHRKLREKFNRLYVNARIGDRDDVWTAHQMLERLLPRREIRNSNLAVRLVQWLALRRNRKRISPASTLEAA